MTFKDQMTTDLPVFFNTDEFADAITYNGVAIVGTVDFDQNLASGQAEVRAVGSVFVKVADVALPAYRDTVVVNGVTWRVVRILEGYGTVWEIEIERDVRPTFGGASRQFPRP